MARVGVLLCRPLGSTLDTVGTDRTILKSERPSMIAGLQELWLLAHKYLRNILTLRESILAAPPNTQRYMTTHAATPQDVEGAIEHPYYNLVQKGRSCRLVIILITFTATHTPSTPGETHRTPPPTSGQCAHILLGLNPDPMVVCTGGNGSPTDGELQATKEA